jgi:hypothetical protein
LRWNALYWNRAGKPDDYQFLRPLEITLIERAHLGGFKTTLCKLSRTGMAFQELRDSPVLQGCWVRTR